MFPLILVVVAGLMGGAWLLFTYEAVANGASSGARAAIVQTSLLSGTSACESGQPIPVQTAVQRAAAIISVNPATLCQSGTDPTELVQSPLASGAANVTLWCTPSLIASQCQKVTVQVAYAFYLPPPFATSRILIRASSTLANLEATGSLGLRSRAPG